ncbi:hypothetical protein ACWD0J_38455 [Streptomyces sp. NPDC003011]
MSVKAAQAHRELTSEWVRACREPFKRVREAADRADGEQKQAEGCWCHSCWDAVIATIVEGPPAASTATGPSGNAAGTIFFDDLFGRSTPPDRG